MSDLDKQIEPEIGLGDVLQAKREELGQTLEEISVKLNIQIKYLQALEQGNYSDLPSLVYIKSFVKHYAQFLGLDFNLLADILDDELNQWQESQLEYSSKDKVLPTRRLVISPRFFRVLGIVIGLLVFMVYLILKTMEIFAVPDVYIYFPPDNFKTSQLVLDVSGETEPEVGVVINGKDILLNRRGYFKERITLQRGVNVVAIEVKKKYSKTKTIYRQIFVETPE